ncbi:MAG TPA: 16S rRNA (uracil(1498)-N(3))-methyltransferase, partial [Chloroflexota bacterium]|nr:16S rRNA (uracil(1498)-N(3))-methyltransferase [Chloroflexota bacterium]
MTHRFFVAPDQIDGETVSFSAAQAHQLRSVLRLRAGDGVLVFDGRASVDQVVILTADARGRITATVPHAAEPATRLVAYPALLQRDKFE